MEVISKSQGTEKVAPELTQIKTDSQSLLSVLYSLSGEKLGYNITYVIRYYHYLSRFI